MSDYPSNHRKVYAKGYFDGMEAARMTPAKQQAGLSGQNSQAKKVFEFVPIKEAWAPNLILGALNRATGSQMDFKVFQACLGALKDSGLIREPSRGMYQRVEVREKVEVKTAKIDPIRAAEVDAMPSGAPKTPIEILSAIAGRLVSVNDEVRKIASDIETAAIVIEEGAARNEENLVKMRQLTSILKSFT